MKKKYSVIKAEVKTLYTISISFSDFWDLYSGYVGSHSMDARKIMYPKAFDKCEQNDTTMGYVRDVFEGKNNCLMHSHGDTYGYIANELGFDGWENAGYYNERSNTYNMVVYKNGDAIN